MTFQYPNATPEQRKFMTTRALVDMYNYWEQQAMVQPSRNPIIAQVRSPPFTNVSLTLYVYIMQNHFSYNVFNKKIFSYYNLTDRTCNRT